MQHQVSLQSLPGWHWQHTLALTYFLPLPSLGAREGKHQCTVNSSNKTLSFSSALWGEGVMAVFSGMLQGHNYGVFSITQLMLRMMMPLLTANLSVFLWYRYWVFLASRITVWWIPNKEQHAWLKQSGVLGWWDSFDNTGRYFSCDNLSNLYMPASHRPDSDCAVMLVLSTGWWRIQALFGHSTFMGWWWCWMYKKMFCIFTTTHCHLTTHSTNIIVIVCITWVTSTQN